MRRLRRSGRSALNKLPGVRASVNYATRIATVDADEIGQRDELCAVVDRAGYAAAPRAERSPPTTTRTRPCPVIFRRLVVAVVLFVPLADLSIMFSVVPDTRITGWQWILVALALPILTWSAWPFYRVAARNLAMARRDGDTHLTGHPRRGRVVAVHDVRHRTRRRVAVCGSRSSTATPSIWRSPPA